MRKNPLTPAEEKAFVDLAAAAAHLRKAQERAKALFPCPKEKKKLRCPHGKKTPIVEMQVVKQGCWEKQNPFGLFIDVFRGGSLQVAQGTKKEMQDLEFLCKKILTDNWLPWHARLPNTSSPKDEPCSPTT